MGFIYWKAVNSGTNIYASGNIIGSIALKMGSISEFIPSSYDGEDAKIYLSAVQQLQNEIKSISKELITVGDNIKSSANIIKSTEDVDLNR